MTAFRRVALVLVVLVADAVLAVLAGMLEGVPREVALVAAWVLGASLALYAAVLVVMRMRRTRANAPAFPWGLLDDAQRAVDREVSRSDQDAIRDARLDALREGAGEMDHSHRKGSMERSAAAGEGASGDAIAK